MDKETLSHYGWIVVLVMILAVLLALATPFGTFVADGFKATYAGFDMVGTSVLDVMKDSTGGCSHKFENSICTKCGEEEPHEHEFNNYQCTICGKADYPPVGQSVTIFGEQYLIVKTDNEAKTVTLITLRNASTTMMPYSTSLETTMFDNGQEGIKYAGSDLDVFLNETFYNSSRMDQMRPYILETPIYQGMWRVANVWSGLDNGGYGIPADTTFQYSTISLYHCQYKGQVYVGERYIYAPDLMDVAEYFGAEVGSGKMIPTPFTLTGSGYSYPDGILTRSASFYGPTYAVESETSYSFGNYSADRVRGATRAMFTVNWEHLPKTAITHICEGGTATCAQKAICKWCNNEYGSLRSHTGGTKTCTQLAICTACNNEYGSLAPHTGGVATCSKQAVCTVCNNEYGEFLPHNMNGNSCSDCGAVGIVMETEHTPYSNGINYTILGTWDYSDAKSVTITITYQTESTSWDWLSITEGTDYVAGSSYNTSRRYLNTNGQIVNATGTSSSVKFGGSTKQTKTFTVEMLTGSVIFRTDGSGNNYYGATVIITPNY
jgi:hypothetical protein